MARGRAQDDVETPLSLTDAAVDHDAGMIFLLVMLGSLVGSLPMLAALSWLLS